MSGWKLSFFAVLFILIGVLASASYVIIDQGVTYTYQQETLDRTKASLDVYKLVLASGGSSYSKKDLVHFLRTEYPNSFIVDNDNKVSIDGNATFCFLEERIAVC
jgi:hypothetical protein